jgi:CheY-like chemotaxis protein
MGGLEIIASVASDARVRSLASNALEAARRGAKLTGQLLAFSRTHRLDTVAVRVNDVIDGMQGMLRHSIGPTVDVRLALDPGCGSAMCDANQIENAVLNLAINARDAMPDGGTLTIATERMTVDASGELAAGDYVAVSVADTGTGMAPDVLARAAEPFFTTKEIGKGTGLGLAQVYGVAHQFGGTVRIESQVGEGTTVRILLPAVQSGIAQAAAAADGPAVVANRHPGADILVVDDDADVRDFLTSTLEALGYRVHSATNGDEGLQLLGRTSPDMMLVDYAMPGLNGAEVARAARSARPNLPIVFVTGYADSDALHEAVGPTAPVLHKPFGVRELARVVERNFVHDAAA